MKQLIYFASAHTSAGYRGLLETNLINIKHVFLIEGATRQERSECIRIFFEKWRARGEEIELILNSVDKDLFQGVINRRLSCAIIDRAEHPDYQIKAGGVIEHLVDLNSTINYNQLESDRDQILALTEEKDRIIKEAHRAFNTGLKIHDDLEQVFIQAMDFNKADRVAIELIEKIFGNKTSKKINPTIRRRFLGASTAKGVTDYVEQLTENVKKRYLIKGRAGSGKSTILRKIVAEAKARNFSIEIYHCGFDPDSLDMVIIRELGMAIFDSTAPHEYEPSRHADELVDLYHTTIAPGTDEKHEGKITHLTIQYKYYIQQGTNQLMKALEKEQAIEQLYHQHFNASLFNQQIEALTERVEALAKYD